MTFIATRFPWECQIINRHHDDEVEANDGWVDEAPKAGRFVHYPMSSEELESRAGGRATEIGFFPYGTEIGIHSKVIEAIGQSWEVEGKPRVRRSRINPNFAHIEVDLVEVE